MEFFYLSDYCWIVFFAFSSVDSLFSQLHKHLKKTRQAAYAAGTCKNHRTQWKAHLSSCLHFDLPYLPASLDTVFILSVFKSFHDPSVGEELFKRRKTSSHCYWFRFSFLRDVWAALTLHGFDHLHRHLPSRAPLVTPALLHTLVQCWVSQFDFVFNCAFLFAFFRFARISNLVPVSARSFDPAKHLCCGDIKITIVVSGYLFLSNGLKLIRWGPKYSPFPYLVILTTFCAQSGLTWRWAPFYQLPLSPCLFTLVGRSGHYIITKLQFMLVFRSHLQRLRIPTLLSLGAIPSVEGELRGLFVLVSQANLFRFMVIGRLMPTKFTLSFLRMRSCASHGIW